MLIAACGDQPTTLPESDRLDTLAEAYAARDGNPELASDLFAEAGPGPALERARLEAWLGTLERTSPDSRSWRIFLESQPHGDLAGRATMSLAKALAAEGGAGAAVTVLIEAPESARDEADLELLEAADDEIAARAAHRLGRNAPHLLRRRSRSVEQAVLADFDHDDWLARASSWRAVGLGSRGAAELRGRRGRGEEEIARRKELARCELDAGSTTRALNALPPRSAADTEELVLRAEAYRRRGWSRAPDPAAIRSFSTCFDEARQAADQADGQIRNDALALVLECGTEAKKLPQALGAWRQLEAARWVHRRRSWLGRRLGVALARSGADSRTVAGLASSLLHHDRCLRYWLSATRSATNSLTELASVEITDLYGHWARRSVAGETGPNHYVPSSPIGAADPPPTVSWLLDNAGPAEASKEWQRLVRSRRPTRREAIAAAGLAAHVGRPNTAIRTLRAAFPEISSTAIAEVPTDAVHAYLPLHWSDHIMFAASETGLDPWLIAALARQESTFIAHARSPAGARGVLQLLPSTARGHARALGFGSRPDLEDPAVNIRIGARELATLIRKFEGLEPALAAYNAGERRVRRWRRQWPDARVFAESVPIPETYTYIRRVVFLSDAYRQVHADAWKEMP